MTEFRKIKAVYPSKPTIEGAGVHLNRVFGYYEVPQFDPFLLLDSFHSSNPADYIAGFPWHPHRGIETITYMLKGEVKHQDSLGNGGTIHSQEVQWMTAGSGIIHSEMPLRQEGDLWGFQLWANLPASHKMMHPRYRDITAQQIPVVDLDENIKVKIIAGEIDGTSGPVQDVITQPTYLDIQMEPEASFTLSTPPAHTAFIFVYHGTVYNGTQNTTVMDQDHVVLFTQGEGVHIRTADQSARFLLVTGQPLNEPVAWRGPIVMNTQAELQLAFQELNEGTFLKHK